MPIVFHSPFCRIITSQTDGLAPAFTIASASCMVETDETQLTIRTNTVYHFREPRGQRNIQELTD